MASLFGISAHDLQHPSQSSGDRILEASLVCSASRGGDATSRATDDASGAILWAGSTSGAAEGNSTAQPVE